MLDHNKISKLSNAIVVSFLEAADIAENMMEAVLAFTYAYQKICLAYTKLDILTDKDLENINNSMLQAANVDLDKGDLINKLKKHLGNE